MAAVTSSRAQAFPIGELSRLTGVNIETIRYYERIKMLPAAAANGRWSARLWSRGAALARLHPAGAGTRLHPY